MEKGYGITVTIERDLTPPELARLKGIEPAKILAWIISGVLRAINYATLPKGRPRWRIKLEDWIAFEDSRAARPKTRLVRQTPRSFGQTRQFFT
ncbi:MAG: DNA-binding protein [Thermoguttaceae bacterium]